jgi:cell division protein FtsN
MGKSGYRLVGKDGKVIYFEKKRPQFNEEQIKKQTDESAKKIDASQSRTIRDFNYIPDSYFENVSEEDKLTIKQDQNFHQSKKIEKQRDVGELKVESSTALVNNKFYLQLGSFKSKEKAEKLLEKSESMGGTVRKIVENKRNGFTFYRVVIGTYNTKPEALNMKEKIVAGGHTDVFVFKN